MTRDRRSAARRLAVRRDGTVPPIVETVFPPARDVPHECKRGRDGMDRRTRRRLGRTIDEIVRLSTNAGLDVDIALKADDAVADIAKLDASLAKLEHLIGIHVRLLAISRECGFADLEAGIADEITRLHELRATILIEARR
jgi:hypothetical protein